MARALHKHTVIVRSYNGACKAISTVETNSVAACGTVHLDLSGVGREAIGRVFGCDTALEGKAASRDVVLGQSELLEGGTCGDLDLCGHNIDARDLFGNGMLDLTVGSRLA
jgi:hypothetical protein